MTQRKSRRSGFIVLLFLSVLLVSCILTPNTTGDTQIDQAPIPESNFPVSDPKSARNAALIYIRDHFGFFVPTTADTWLEKDITPEGIVGSAGTQFTTGNWTISVIYPLTAPESTVFTIIMTNPGLQLFWEGQVNAFGRITETSASTDYVEENSVVDSQTVASTPLPSATPRNSTLNFSDDTYRLTFEYPSSWSLSVVPAGQITSTGAFAAKTIKLTKEGITLKIQYKLLWEETELGSGLPPGNLEFRGSVTLLGQEIPQHVVVKDGKDKLVFYGNSVDDLSYHFRLETTSDELPENALNIAEQIAASVTRTGVIFSSPTPTQTPTITPVPSPTSKFDSTRSGSGTGVNENCNIAEFIAHQNLPEGATVPPGAQFIKIWRVQNVGTCTWNSSYSVAYSDGDLMGANESNPFGDEEVGPGELTNLSVSFTAPQEEGEYESYWILNDPSGNWFGWGAGKRGLFEVDIIVAVPDQIYAYDFAWKYCDASWTSGGLVDDEEEVNQLGCPPKSSDGSVILLSSPQMEHRDDDELTLKVHPMETRYGWIRGKYPEFTIQSGDRFKSWVGCMADMNMCAIEFRLYYVDASGTTYILDKWFEKFDGNATQIDIDLSFLAGQNVRFILETVAMTENTDKAHGFWFVPRIERP